MTGNIFAITSLIVTVCCVLVGVAICIAVCTPDHRYAALVVVATMGCVLSIYSATRIDMANRLLVTRDDVQRSRTDITIVIPLMGPPNKPDHGSAASVRLAYEIAERMPKRTVTVVLSGGHTVSTRSEAEATLDFIRTLRGTPPNIRILLETRSLTTRQNALFSAALLRENGLANQPTYILTHAVPLFGHGQRAALAGMWGVNLMGIIPAQLYTGTYSMNPEYEAQTGILESIGLSFPLDWVRWWQYRDNQPA